MIRIIYRTCGWNNHNNRPDWFHYRKCWENLVDTSKIADCAITVLYDGELQGHEEYNYAADVLQIDSAAKLPELYKEWELRSDTYIDHDEQGREIHKRVEAPDREKASGYLMYELIKDNIDDWNNNDIIYLVEDDYMHMPGWTTVLQNVYDMYDSINYVSLYDHPDKYTPRYQGLQSQIIVSNYCHWRTVPSSCGTFAGRVKTFKEDLDIHMGSLGDHNKFTLLAERNRNIISALPAFATHCVHPWTSPFRDWANV